MERISHAGPLACITGIVLVLSCHTAEGQCDSTVNGGARGGDVTGAIGVFAPLFFPKVFLDTYRLKEYIRGDEFRKVRQRYGDLCSVDFIFEQALSLSWGNRYEALFIMLFATMDHKNFGLKLPVIGSLLWLPLTAEFDEDFRSRLAALPSRLYGDTPRGRAGDRDKLQHFFGSAFLAYLLESRDAADRVGNFIEWGEDLFVVGGVNDPRDLRADRQGAEFAMHLLEDGDALPSGYFESSPTERLSSVPAACVPHPLPDSITFLMEER